MERPALVFLHFLGGSAREWQPTVSLLSADFACVPLDLPGFGDAAGEDGFDVESMAESISKQVAARIGGELVLVGHSMGAKVAAAIARKRVLPGLVGMVLLSGSPPAPEPMAETRREEMLGWFQGDARTSRSQARAFIAANANPRVDGAAVETLADQLLRMDVRAWQAWLQSGSREDWSARIGRLSVPTLLLAGELDADLGPEAQRTLMLPHFAHARLEVLPGTRHLATIECPERLAEHIARHARSLGGGVPSSYRALIASERVSEPTRQALRERLLPDDPDFAPSALTPEAFAILRAVTLRLLPQASESPIDLAARLDAQLAQGSADGWRYAELPPDREAWELGLRTLESLAMARHGTSFPALGAADQDALLRTMLERDSVLSVPGLSARQRFLWFEDLRAQAVQLYLSHPATLARMGYSGIADGARGEGFHRIGPGEREGWEP